MMESWPTVLPQQPDQSFDSVQSSGLLDPSATLYPVRTRTYPEHADTYTFRALTVDQFQAFRAWWDVTLNQCAPFAAPWLAVVGHTHHFCRFDGEQPWEASMRGIWIDVTIKVEIIATVSMVAGAVAYGEV